MVESSHVFELLYCTGDLAMDVLAAVDPLHQLRELFDRGLQLLVAVEQGGFALQLRGLLALVKFLLVREVFANEYTGQLLQLAHAGVVNFLQPSQPVLQVGADWQHQLVLYCFALFLFLWKLF